MLNIIQISIRNQDVFAKLSLLRNNSEIRNDFNKNIMSEKCTVLLTKFMFLRIVNKNTHFLYMFQ